MKRNFTVYKHVSPSGKIYIGITCQSTDRRWRNGKGYKSNSYFTKAIKKYGWDSFSHEILFENFTKDEAKLMEQIYIVLYNANDRDKGYNITSGGEGTIGYKHTKEAKEKMSINHIYPKGEKHPMFGKHHSEESNLKNREAHLGKYLSKNTKMKISKSLKGKHSGKNNPMYGIKGEKHPNAKKIRCLETGETFNCIKDASEEKELNYSSLRAAIKNKRKYKGYTFIYID